MRTSELTSQPEVAPVRPRRSAGGILKLVTAVVVLITAVLALVAENRRREAEEQVSTLSDEVTGLSGQLDAWERNLGGLNIRFTRPEGTIPHCTDFSGSGAIPDGWQLLIFDRSAADPNASYWFNGVAEPTDQGWVARSVQIGEGEPDEGRRVEIAAVLVLDRYAAYLSSIQAGNDGGVAYWWAGSLPAEPVDTVFVERNSDATPCR